MSRGRFHAYETVQSMDGPASRVEYESGKVERTHTVRTRATPRDRSPDAVAGRCEVTDPGRVTEDEYLSSEV